MVSMTHQKTHHSNGRASACPAGRIVDRRAYAMRTRCARASAIVVLAVLTILTSGPLAAQQGTTPAKPKAKSTHAADSTPAKPDTVQHFSGVIGVAIDSIHGTKLEGATVSVVGTNRHGITDSQGQFRIDSVPPGEYRLTVSHPELDTLALAVTTQPIAMPIGRYAVVRLSTPSAIAVLGLYCPKEKLLAGPGAVVGRVLDADTDAPDSGARVVLYWTQLDVSAAIGVKHIPRVRETHVDEHGMFSICGIPATLDGQLRASLGKQVTADVPINVQDGLLTLAMLHVAAPDTAPPPPPAPVASTPGAKAPVIAASNVVTGLRTGHASVTGRVTDESGRPLEGVDVSLQGAAPTTQTAADGTFTLRGLPAGTQALILRHLGFALTNFTVDLSNINMRRADVKMAPAPPMLAAVRVEGKRDKGLRDVGYTTREKAGIGVYITEDQIAQRQPTQMTDLFTQVRGIRVQYTSEGYPVLSDSRDATGGCVSYVIDGVPTPMPDPTDFNDFMHPDEVSAIEVYTAAEAPAQFQTGGSSSCEVIVIWTKTKIGG
jgi:Carboxypeptidase regulatory-like domain/TonB-dependent Receptor Plug Domain